MEPLQRQAMLEDWVNRYVASVWTLAIKRDVRAELLSRDSATHIYLEVEPDGTVSERRWHESGADGPPARTPPVRTHYRLRGREREQP